MGSMRRQGRRRYFAPLTAAFLLSVCLSSAFAQAGIAVPADSDGDELYLLDVHAAGRVLGESVPAHARGDGFFVELGTLVASLEFPITRRDHTWSGWFFGQDRSFSWQMDIGLVEIADRESEIVAAGSWFEADGEVFVAEPLLEHWFGIELEVDARQQVLHVSADEPLPFQLWHERTLAKYRHRGPQRFEPDVVVPDQYNWATQPLVNFDSQIVARNDGDERTTSRTTSIAAGMDLLKQSVTFTGAFTRNTGAASDPTDTTRRLTVEKYAEIDDAPIFGDIHHYAFGDIFLTSPNLVTVANAGRGLTFDRYSDAHAGNLSSVTIADDAPPGWEVELYRNGTLVDFATVGPDGRYFFPDQDVYFGENEFVVRLYGPQGQVREDRETFFGGGIELAPGDYDYNVSHIDFSRNLLDGRPENYAALPASYATDLRYSRAISADVEVGGAFTQTGLAGRDRDGTFVDQDYLSLFGRARLGPGVLVGEAVDQLDAGEALSLEYLTGLGGKTFSFVQRVFDDYDSPATLQSEPLDALSEFSALGSFGPGDRNGYRAGIRRRELRGGASDLRLFGRIGSRLGPLSLANELEYRVDGDENTALGLVRLAGRVHGISIRGQIDYSLSGSSAIRQVSTSMNWDVSPRLNDSFTFSRNFDAIGGSYASNIVSLRVRDFNLSFGATTDFGRDWSLAAGVGFAFGYDARRRSFVTDYRSLAHTGRATMSLFVDRNNNGIRDPGESPVDGAKYRGQAATDSAPGAMTLTELPGETEIQIDTSRFEFDDPFLIPRLNGYEVRTHAGSDIEIDVAVVMTGDIEGTLLESENRPARGIPLTLLDAEGEEVAVARTEFDGYYSFTEIPGGEYRIAREDADGGFEILQRVTLDAERGFVTADDIYLESFGATETPP